MMMLGLFTLGGALSAQVQLKQLEESGTAIFDINNDGEAVMRNGYYDFQSHSTTPKEAQVGQISANNDSGIILGNIDDGNGNLIPALRIDNV